MSSHRVTPNLDVQMRRTFRPIILALARLGKSISEAGALTRDDYTLTASLADEPVTPLWSPDPPSMPAGHVWMLPGGHGYSTSQSAEDQRAHEEDA